MSEKVCEKWLAGDNHSRFAEAMMYCKDASGVCASNGSCTFEGSCFDDVPDLYALVSELNDKVDILTQQIDKITSPNFFRMMVMQIVKDVA